MSAPGLKNKMLGADPPSPKFPGYGAAGEVPAIVDMIPEARLTRRILPPPDEVAPSVINTDPQASKATPFGWYMVAAVARPPSPALDETPVPANVLIMPVDTLTKRTLLPAESTM